MNMKRVLLLLTLLFACSSVALARGHLQGIAVYSQTVTTAGSNSTNKFTRVLANATVTVYCPPTTTTICTIYSDSAGTAKANPFTAGADGSYGFYTDAQSVSIRFSNVSGVSAFTTSDIPITAGDSVTTLVCGNVNDTSLLSTANTAGGTIVIPKGITCASNSQSISVTLQIDNGGLLKPITGQALTLTGPQIGGAWQRFTNALSGQGTISFAGNHSIDKMYLEWWGGKADGTTDNTAIWNAATSQPPPLRLMVGTYLFNTNPNAPTCQAIIGAGNSDYGSGSILKAGASVTKLISLPNGATQRLENFKVDGSLTTGATGIVAGDGSGWTGSMANLYIVRFSGAGGVGIRLADVVSVDLWNPRLTNDGSNGNGNNINILFQGISQMNEPTNVRIHGGYLSTAQTKGLKFVTGYQTSLFGTIFESNAEEGTYLNSAVAGDILDVRFYGCHWEDNNGNDATHYQFKALGANSRTIRFSIIDPFSNPTGSTKSFLFDGGTGAVAGLKLDYPQVPNTSGQISAVNGAYGTLANFPRNLTYATVINDPSNNLVAFPDALLSAWSAWTPTYSSNLGNAATTFSGAVTTDLAIYKQIGKTLYININFSGTLNAVTPSDIRFTMPNSLLPDANDKETAASEVGDNGVTGNGWVNFVATAPTTGRCFKSAAGNFTSASFVSCRFAAVISVQ